jgi:hypothetical protein
MMGRDKAETHSHPFGKRDCVMVGDEHTAARDNEQAASSCPEQYPDKESPSVTKLRERRVGAASAI